jgi:hypothetical protein
VSIVKDLIYVLLAAVTELAPVVLCPIFKLLPSLKKFKPSPAAIVIAVPSGSNKLTALASVLPVLEVYTLANVIVDGSQAVLPVIKP